MRFCFSGGSVAGCQQCLSGAQAPASLLPPQILGKKPRAHLRAPKRRNLRLCSHQSPLLFFFFKECPDNCTHRQHHLGPALWVTPLPAPVQSWGNSRGKRRGWFFSRPKESKPSSSGQGFPLGPVGPGWALGRAVSALAAGGGQPSSLAGPGLVPALAGHRDIPHPGRARA